MGSVFRNRASLRTSACAVVSRFQHKGASLRTGNGAVASRQHVVIKGGVFFGEEE